MLHGEKKISNCGKAVPPLIHPHVSGSYGEKLWDSQAVVDDIIVFILLLIIAQ